jgi:hypothetical protein
MYVIELVVFKTLLEVFLTSAYVQGQYLAYVPIRVKYLKSRLPFCKEFPPKTLLVVSTTRRERLYVINCKGLRKPSSTIICYQYADRAYHV